MDKTTDKNAFIVMIRFVLHFRQFDIKEAPTHPIKRREHKSKRDITIKGRHIGAIKHLSESVQTITNAPDNKSVTAISDRHITQINVLSHFILFL